MTKLKITIAFHPNKKEEKNFPDFHDATLIKYMHRIYVGTYIQYTEYLHKQQIIFFKNFQMEVLRPLNNIIEKYNITK